jgi:hypothetical protein
LLATTLLAFIALAPVATHGIEPPDPPKVTVVDTEDFVLKVGMRMQPRLSFSKGLSADESEVVWRRDFMIARSRLKLAGKMANAKFSFEWRFDGTGRGAGLVNEALATAVENMYIQWPLAGPEFQVRAGLYDQPFSRDRLTSDSKQMGVDRGIVSGTASFLGMADNVIGVDLRGSVADGRYWYAVGVFDNRTIEGPLQNQMPMIVGRVDLNLGSSKNVYRDAHFGDDSWYSIGGNFNYQSKLEDDAGNDEGENSAFGFDGMIDVPVNEMRVLVRGEVNSIGVKAPTGGDTVRNNVWMLGGGWLFWDQRLQAIVRFDQILTKEEGLIPDLPFLEDIIDGSGNIMMVGLNLYQMGHNLKIQGDLSFASGTGDSVDRGRLQAQIDF